RTPRPARNCRPVWSWLMMVWSWKFRDQTAQRSRMDVIHFPEDARPARWSHPVLALGNFDGVHRGHRKILDRVQRGAYERGATSLYGHARAGNFSLLRALGNRYLFKAEKIDPVRYKDFVVSSTRVRRLVSEGRVDEAGALLGHQYFIDGTVMKGDQRGRTIGFPTANLCTENELLPPNGVYATTTRIGEIVHASVTNIGTRPTVDSSGRTVVET